MLAFSKSLVKTYQNLCIPAPSFHVNLQNTQKGNKENMVGKYDTPSRKRQYPPIYEKLVPVTLGILGIIIIVMLVYTLGVALGIITG